VKTKIKYASQVKKIFQIPKLLFVMFKPKSWGPLLHAFQRTQFDHDFSVSWSQCGEDLSLVALLQATRKSGFYIDVGAHHPDRFSVTRALYDIGWTGINIDADAEVERDFLRKRPLDKFLVGAVGTKEFYDFYRSKEKAVSTANLEWKNRYANAGFIFETKVRVKGIKLRELLESLPNRIELLNVDIEGQDLDALLSLELDSLNRDLWPEWIMVESAPPISEAINNESVAYLLDKDYEIWGLLPMVAILRRTT